MTAAIRPRGGRDIPSSHLRGPKARHRDGATRGVIDRSPSRCIRSPEDPQEPSPSSSRERRCATRPIAVGGTVTLTSCPQADRSPASTIEGPGQVRRREDGRSRVGGCSPCHTNSCLAVLVPAIALEVGDVVLRIVSRKTGPDEGEVDRCEKAVPVAPVVGDGGDLGRDLESGDRRDRECVALPVENEGGRRARRRARRAPLGVRVGGARRHPGKRSRRIRRGRG